MSVFERDLAFCKIKTISKVLGWPQHAMQSTRLFTVCMVWYGNKSALFESTLDPDVG